MCAVCVFLSDCLHATSAFHTQGCDAKIFAKIWMSKYLCVWVCVVLSSLAFISPFLCALCDCVCTCVCARVYVCVCVCVCRGGGANTSTNTRFSNCAGSVCGDFCSDWETLLLIHRINTVAHHNLQLSISEAKWRKSQWVNTSPLVGKYVEHVVCAHDLSQFSSSWRG